jgi:methylenetetrahydrofolate reductase (NADPH)
MKITEHLKSSKDTLFSIEILPPLKGKSIQSIFDGIDPLMEFKPAFVDVTYHREEYIYKKREGGYLESKHSKAPWNCWDLCGYYESL